MLVALLKGKGGCKMDNKQKRAKLIDSYSYNGQAVELHLMSNGTLLILHFKTASREILASYNSRKDNLDEMGIANKFEEIKTRIINRSVVRPVKGKGRNQTNLFAAT